VPGIARGCARRGGRRYVGSILPDSSTEERMTEPDVPSRNHVEKPAPGFREQLLVTLGVLLATGAVFGGIWVLDTIAH
jgi:hypothetical protein